MNEQKPEKVDFRSDQVEVVGSPWTTIQGEGPFAGTPAIFVRLAGCNLTCPYCDTDYTSNRGWRHIQYLADSIDHYKPRLVVLTGGEPFRQWIVPLMRKLMDRGKVVQVETNGTLNPLPIVTATKAGVLEAHRTLTEATIVCSPKTPAINKDLLPYISAYKYILQADQVDTDGLPLRSLGMDCRPARPHCDDMRVFVQPMDESEEMNKRNMDAAVRSCLQFGYTLSLQMHKIAGLP